MVLAAKFYAWLLKAAIVLSYHTHVPSYLPRYGIQYLVPAMWGFLRILHVTAHLTLTVSPAMVDELVANRAVNDRKQVQVSADVGGDRGPSIVHAHIASGRHIRFNRVTQFV